MRGAEQTGYKTTKEATEAAEALGFKKNKRDKSWSGCVQKGEQIYHKRC